MRKAALIHFLKHLEEVELAYFSTLFNVCLAQRRLAAVLGEDQASRLHSTVLAELLKQKSFYIVEEANRRIRPRVGSMQLSNLNEDGT